jgi:hypothetical protein
VAGEGRRQPEVLAAESVQLDDGFRADAVDVVKPFMICNPADTDGSGVGDASARLCC